MSTLNLYVIRLKIYLNFSVTQKILWAGSIVNWNSSDPFRTVLKLVRGGAFKGWRWSGFGWCVCEYEVVRQFNFFESSCFPPEKNAFDFFLSILCYVL